MKQTLSYSGNFGEERCRSIQLKFKIIYENSVLVLRNLDNYGEGEIYCKVQESDCMMERIFQSVA